MKRLVPSYVLNKQIEQIDNGYLNAATMFIDISGFTAMTQKLMKNGKEGAEILTTIINNIFTPSIDAIYDNCGFISTFAGDAFTAIFPLEDVEAASALQAALKIQKIFQQIGLQKSKFGDFQLAVKIGLSAGNVEWRLIENDIQNTYYFRGEAIDNCAQSEHQCSLGDTVFDFNLMDMLKSNGIDVAAEPLNRKHYRIKEDFQLSPIACAVSDEDYPDEKINSFVPQVILDRKLKGEFRDIISAFISFEENENLLTSVSDIIALTHQYGGYFNKIDFGDKGAVALVLFGAPVGREKLQERACDFSLKVRESGKSNGLNLRIGLTFGKVFAGFVGSERRCEYTALGTTVNLSARFMMKAQWGEIYLDRRITTDIEHKFEIAFKQEEDFKGFTGKVPYYLLVRKNSMIEKQQFKGELVGREAELAELQAFTRPLQQNQFGGLVYIDGVAGIGKSRLVDELKNKLVQYNWLLLPCDEILRKSFNPFIHYFNVFFNQTEDNSAEVNLENFESEYAALIDSGREQLQTELVNGKPFLGALLNLFWAGSLYEQVDAKTRYENTLFAIKSFFKVLAVQKPLIIELDDGHWIDNDSRRALQVLTRNVENYPLMIISACRYNDDETVFDFELEDIPVQRLELQYLDRELSRYLIISKLAEILRIPKVDLPEELFEFIWEKSAGNPFYIEQIILYLHDHNILDQDLKLKRLQIEIPSNINAIIVARIDRLSEDVKEVIKTASVIGKEFVVKILSTMLNSLSIEFKSDKLNNVIQTGKTENIWNSIQEIKYIFKHALIRESVYEIQLKERLRELHKLAAETIEEIYLPNLDEYLEDLAFHYERAEIAEKAILYLDKAGFKAKDDFRNEKALDLFDRKKTQLLVALKASSLEEIRISENNRTALDDLIETSIQINHLLHLTGRYDQVEELLRPILELAQKIKDQEKVGKINLDLAGHLSTVGKIDKAIEHLKKAESIFLKLQNDTMLGVVYRGFGTSLMRKGEIKQAFDFFSREIQHFQKSGNKLSIIDALGNIGVMHCYLGNLDKALLHLNKQLQMAEESQNKLQIARALSNIGWVYEGKNNITEAIDYYNRALMLFRQLAIKSEIVRIQDNTGFAYQQIGEYAKASEYHQIALELAIEIGDQESIVYSTVNLAHACAGLEDVENSTRNYQLGIELAEKYNYLKPKADALIGYAELLYSQAQIEQSEAVLAAGLKIAREQNYEKYLQRGENLQKQMKEKK